MAPPLFFYPVREAKAGGCRRCFFGTGACDFFFMYGMVRLLWPFFFFRVGANILNLVLSLSPQKMPGRVFLAGRRSRSEVPPPPSFPPPPNAQTASSANQIKFPLFSPRENPEHHPPPLFFLFAAGIESLTNLSVLPVLYESGPKLMDSSLPFSPPVPVTHAFVMTSVSFFWLGRKISAATSPPPPFGPTLTGTPPAQVR